MSNGKNNTVGIYLLFAYLISGMVGKSFLENTSSIWMIYQVSTVTLSAFLVLFVINVKSREAARQERNAVGVQRAYILLFAFIVWGGLPNFLQGNLIKNFTAYGCFGVMLIAVCIYARFLLGEMSSDRIVIMLSILLFVATFASLVAGVLHLQYTWRNGRLVGVYNNPLIGGALATIGSLLLLHWIASDKRKTRIPFAMLFISLTVLLMTRTRSAIFGFCIAAGVWLLHRMFIVRDRKSLRPAWNCVVFLIAVATFLHFLGFGSIEESKEFLRINEKGDEVLNARMQYWQTGLGDLTVDNIIGAGYLAAFTGSDKISGYDIDANRHNMFLSCAQSYGVPGFLLFVCFLISCILIYLFRHDSMASLGLGIIGYCLLSGMAENMLLSFGNPANRFAWFLIGITLSHKQKQGSHLRRLILRKKGGA